MRKILFVIVLLIGTLQPWWGDTPWAMAEEPIQEKLAITIAPPVLPSDESTESVIYVQLIGPDGVPRLASEDTEVFLISSDPWVVRVPERIHISEGESYAITSLTTTSVPGKVTITAVHRGRAPATAEIETVDTLEAIVRGQIPVQLKAYLAPHGMLGVESTPGFLIVQVLDGSGLPVMSPDDIPIRLVGLDETLPQEVVVPRGRSFVRMELGWLQPGMQAELWLVNADLVTAQVSLKSLTLPTSVAVVVSEGPLFSGQRRQIQIQVQSAGSALPQARLNWRATNGTLSDATPETDEKGEGWAVFTAGEPGEGIIEVVVNKAGYEETRAQAAVPVVAEVETSKSAPRLLGIPVLYLFLTLLVVLVGYLLYKLLPAIRRRPSTDAGPEMTDDKT